MRFAHFVPYTEWPLRGLIGTAPPPACTYPPSCKPMKATIKLAVCLTIAGAWFFLWKVTRGKHSHERSPEEILARGAELVRLGRCSDCHTPKIMTPEGPVDDETRLFAGHFSGPAAHETEGTTSWAGPWGTSYASNLTPDPATGLWSEASFIKAMRTGRRRGHDRAILPPMPWQELSRRPDADLKAIYAYLSSLPAVFNSVPEPVPPPDSAAVSSAGVADEVF